MEKVYVSVSVVYTRLGQHKNCWTNIKINIGFWLFASHKKNLASAIIVANQLIRNNLFLWVAIKSQ